MNFNFPVLAPPPVESQQWNQDMTNILNQHSVALQQINQSLQQINATLLQIQQQQEQLQLPGNMTNASRRLHNKKPGALLLPLNSAGRQLPLTFPANEVALLA